MARQTDFGRNQILRATFLNTLQDILESYIDNFMLSFSGDRVIATGTAADPIAVTIERRMRHIPTTIEATPTGGAGTRQVYIVIRTTGITLEATTSPTVPTGLDLVAYRHVGTAAWNGAAVTSVSTNATMQNGDYLAGRSSSQVSSPYDVPYSRDDGTLDPSWFPEIEGKEEIVGTIKRQWVPSAGFFSVPTGWVPLDGRTLTPSQHAFPGVGTVVLPDMRNKIPLGADITKAVGAVASAVNSAAGAPGRGGISGSNANRSFPHYHAVAAHHHDIVSHQHGMAHTHVVPDHTHSMDNFQQSYDPGGDWKQRMFTGDTGGVNGGAFTSGASNQTLTDGTGGVTGDSGSGNTATAIMGPVDVRPAHVGLAFMLKVL